jgi:hypothetical protein
MMRYAPLLVCGLLVGETLPPYEIKHDKETIFIMKDCTMTWNNIVTHEDVPLFSCKIQNVSGEDQSLLEGPHVVLHRMNKPDVAFDMFGMGEMRPNGGEFPNFKKDSTVEITHGFGQREPYAVTDVFTSVEFSLLDGWHTMKEMMAEDRKEKAKEQAEFAKMKSLCAAVRRATINKKVSDLTVKETENIRICRSWDLY